MNAISIRPGDKFLFPRDVNIYIFQGIEYDHGVPIIHAYLPPTFKLPSSPVRLIGAGLYDILILRKVDMLKMEDIQIQAEGFPPSPVMRPYAMQRLRQLNQDYYLDEIKRIPGTNAFTTRPVLDRTETLNNTCMINFFTLGQIHRHVLPNGKVWDKDGVIRVFADSESQARNFIIMHVGLLWSNQETRIDLSYYPKGIIADVFLTVPSMKDFGYQQAQGFDEEGGWEIEGGEEAYEEVVEMYIAVGQNQFISGL